MREEFRAKLAALRDLKNCSSGTVQPPPRYDDVFFEGTAWLERENAPVRDDEGREQRMPTLVKDEREHARLVERCRHDFADAVEETQRQAAHLNAVNDAVGDEAIERARRAQRRDKLDLMTSRAIGGARDECTVPGYEFNVPPNIARWNGMLIAEAERQRCLSRRDEIRTAAAARGEIARQRRIIAGTVGTPTWLVGSLSVLTLAIGFCVAILALALLAAS